jgi:DoxX-like family
MFHQETPGGQLVQTSVASTAVSSVSLWAGRILSAVVFLFMLFDGGAKVMRMAPAIEGTARLGYPASLVVPIGLAGLVCTVLYAIPRTTILGAILLTGYLGGATATQVRVQDPWFLFPVAVGVLVWVGPFLRDERLRALVPLRSPKSTL